MHLRRHPSAAVAGRRRRAGSRGLVARDRRGHAFGSGAPATIRSRSSPCVRRRSGPAPSRSIAKVDRCIRRSSGWTRAGPSTCPSSSAGMLRVQGYGARKLAAWLHRTGGIPSLGGKEPVAHIQFLRHERPEVYRRAHMFLEPKDWLDHRLCGRFCATVDSIALHWVTDNRDIDHIGYDGRLLEMAGLERARLPELVRADRCDRHRWRARGRRARARARGAGVRRHRPTCNRPRVGSGAVRDFEPHLYIGTSSWLSCHLPFKKTDILRNMASLPSALPGRYLPANSQETAGACIAWLRDAVLWPKDAARRSRPAADAFARIDALAGHGPAGQRRRAVHPVAVRRALPRPPTRRSAARSPTSRSRPRGRTSCARCSRASRSTPAGCSRAPNTSSDADSIRIRIIGGGASSEHVVPHLRRRARPRDRPGARPGAQQRPRCGVPRLARPRPSAGRRARRQGADRRALPAARAAPRPLRRAATTPSAGCGRRRARSTSGWRAATYRSPSTVVLVGAVVAVLDTVADPRFVDAPALVAQHFTVVAAPPALAIELVAAVGTVVAPVARPTARRCTRRRRRPSRRRDTRRRRLASRGRSSPRRRKLACRCPARGAARSPRPSSPPRRAATAPSSSGTTSGPPLSPWQASWPPLRRAIPPRAVRCRSGAR